MPARSCQGRAGWPCRRRRIRPHSAQVPRPSQPALGLRVGQSTVAITVCHVEPGVRHQLKVLAAERDMTVHQLVGEGVNMVFAQHGRPEIAR